MSSTTITAVLPHGRDIAPWSGWLWGWMSSLGMRTVAFFAAMDDATSRPGGGYSGGPRPDAAQPCNTTGACTPVRCCCLACANVECPYVGSKENFTCPGGVKTYWTCVEGSTKIGCGECAGGSSCFSSPWYCSIWFTIN